MPIKRVRKGGEASRPAADGKDDHRRSHVTEATSAILTELMNLDESLLNEEVAYYLAHRRGWYEHEGEHVLIQGQHDFGFFPTRDAALEEGFRRFGRVAFLVKEVRQNEEPRPLAWTIL